MRNHKRPASTDAGESENEIRVTDRRRIYLDDQGVKPTGQTEQPNLKPTYVEELEKRTQAAEKQVQEVQGRFEQLRQQLQRETDETRQRLNRAASERAEREKAQLIATVLPAFDDLRRAIQAAESGASAETLIDGVRRTAASFENALLAAGVEPIESVGEVFDPEKHEAVDTGETEDALEGKVIAEYSRGFRFGDKLLRPARVKVGRARNESRQATNAE